MVEIEDDEPDFEGKFGLGAEDECNNYSTSKFIPP